jgi:hypothetical protein
MRSCIFADDDLYQIIKITKLKIVTDKVTNNGEFEKELSAPHDIFKQTEGCIRLGTGEILMIWKSGPSS